MLCSCQSLEKETEKEKKVLSEFTGKRENGKRKELFKNVCVRAKRNALIYNHSGDDGRKDPPVPIPNTEVKLSNAESTCGSPPGG